jgi:ribonuclease P protein component
VQLTPENPPSGWVLACLGVPAPMIARADRLRKGSEFARARARGRSWSARLVVAVVLPNALGRNRYGFAAGKRVGGAVERNRAKRLLREAVRALHPRLAAGHDIVFIARNTFTPASSLAEVSAQVEQVLGRAGLVGPAGDRDDAVAS